MGMVAEKRVRKSSEGYEDKEEEIFVNRSLNLAKIRCYGFDMDYTLCEYISPQLDGLACNLAKQFMVDSLGYSKAILDIEYNQDFPVRGLWFDRQKGNLLKVDQFEKILECYHGFRILKPAEIKAMYPGKIQRKDYGRVFVMNTIFNLAETFLIAALVDHFDQKQEYEKTENGWVKDGENLLFASLFEDLRAAIDDMHIGSCFLKKHCLADLHRYVKNYERLPVMLDNIKRSGRKTFLLTNSDWWHTRQIMTFLLGNEGDERDSWLSYFDLVVVDASKPHFFTSGTPLQYVDTSTCALLPLSSCPPGPTVYSGGDHATISTMLAAKGPDVMYAGDHLYGDVIKCRKHCEWRTLLIVPELSYELGVNKNSCELMAHIGRLETALASNPDVPEVKNKLREAVNKLNQRFSMTGSLLRSGSRMTYFASQLHIWADLYTDSIYTLAGYDLDHKFIKAPTKLAQKTGARMKSST